MRKLVLLALPIVAGSCNATAVGFGAVAIRPIYGWDDGCNDVQITGHGFEEGATAAIGANPVANLTHATGELEAGFQMSGQAPAGAVGFSDLVVTNPNGESDTVPRAYYYVACPAGGAFPYAEAADKTEGVVAGDVITLTGCDLAAGSFTVQVGDADPVPLTSVCGEGAASFVAPDLPADAAGYELTFYQGNTIVYPTVDCTPPVVVDTDADTDVADTDLDTDAETDVSGGDSADTGTPCDAQIVLIYGGAQ